MSECNLHECVCNYLVICPDVASEDRKVVKPKRHIVAHVLVQPLIIWAGVTMETHMDIICGLTLRRHTHRSSLQCNSCFGEGTVYAGVCWCMPSSQLIWSACEQGVYNVSTCPHCNDILTPGHLKELGSETESSEDTCLAAPVTHRVKQNFSFIAKFRSELKTGS